jgi:hypothetical protein
MSSQQAVKKVHARTRLSHREDGIMHLAFCARAAEPGHPSHHERLQRIFSASGPSASSSRFSPNAANHECSVRVLR